MKKSILFVLAFTLLACAFAGANQKNVSTGEKFTFLSSSSSVTGGEFSLSDVTEFAKKSNKSSKSSSKAKAASFKNMGIAGAALLGISIALWVTGAVLMGVSVYLMGGAGFSGFSAALYGGSFNWTHFLSTEFILYGVGSALFAIFFILMWVGLALTIVGFAVSRYYSKKAGVFFEGSPELGFSSYGLSIKL